MSNSLPVNRSSSRKIAEGDPPAMWVLAVMICVLFSFPLTLEAQTSFLPESSFDFSGYVVEMPVYEVIRKPLAQLAGTSTDQWTNLVRLRLRPTVRFGDNTKLALEYEADGLYFSQSPSFEYESGAPLRQAYSLRWEPVSEAHFNVVHYIDRLYLDHDFSFGKFVIGRQRISWGTGRVWNPTDVFNPINPANFGKIEKDGSDAATMKFYLGQLTDLQVVYNAEYHFRSSNYAGRFRTNIGGYDFSVMTGYVDKRALAGGDFAGDVEGAGVRGEALVSANTSGANDYFVKWILGADYQFTDKLYGMVEYYHNGEGSPEKSGYDLFSLFAGRILNLAQDYVVVGGNYLVHPLVTVALSANSNLNDGSGFVSGTVTYSLSDNNTLAAGTLFTYGGTKSEYWYYPRAYYLKFEGFF